MGDRWQRWKDSQPVPEDLTVPGIAQREKEVVVESGGRPHLNTGPEKVRRAAIERGWGEVSDDLDTHEAFLWVEGYAEGFVQASIILGMTS